MYPAYLNSYKNGGLEQAAEKTHKLLESCVICPRKCRINRLKNQKGFCQTGALARVYSYFNHQGEEPPISGVNGSGTIFFSGCNLACRYCQNYKFSQNQAGEEAGAEKLADFMLELQGKGCHNINLVTPTHVMPQVLKALIIAASGGLKIPLVYNTSGYELPEMIKLLNGIVDIYLTDMRYADKTLSRRYSQCPDYPFYNQAAVLEMNQQTGPAEFDQNGIIKKGLIIRHLVLPHEVAGSEEIFRFISREISPEAYISLMSQYTPYHQAAKDSRINRRITIKEYQAAERLMDKYGLRNGWTQEINGQDGLAGIHIKPLGKQNQL